VQQQSEAAVLEAATSTLKMLAAGVPQTLVLIYHTTLFMFQKTKMFIVTAVRFPSFTLTPCSVFMKLLEAYYHSMYIR
jgi:hypothetical protein